MHIGNRTGMSLEAAFLTPQVHSEQPIAPLASGSGESAPTGQVPPDFYRLHTYATKGPNRRELRDYINRRGATPPDPGSRQPFTKGWAKDLWAAMRIMRLPQDAARAAEIVANNPALEMDE